MTKFKVGDIVNMQNYYTPDIEDLRIGYICELIKNDGPNREWKPHVFYSENYFDLEGTHISIRTPYLTKEDIENLGWISTGPSPNGYFHSFEKEGGLYSIKTKWRLEFYKNDKWLAPIKLRYFISEKGILDSYAHWSEEFEFESKSKNELIQIQKLLGI